MMRRQSPLYFFVKILTLVVLLTSAGCSTGMGNRYKGVCNSRAYLQFVLNQYLSRRFSSKAPVRLGIIPFSVQANLAYHGSEFPGIGSKLAWQLQRELLRSGEIPIVEVFNRQDWPGKKEEFNTGNHGSIALGRQAGYDLLMVGVIERLRSLDQVTSTVKLIEVESGTTIWFGTSTVSNPFPEKAARRIKISWGRSKRRPDLVHISSMIPDMASCIVRELLSQTPLPPDETLPIEEKLDKIGPERRTPRRNSGDQLF